MVADATSPQAASSSILLTAIMDDSAEYEYRFESQRGDGDWTVLRSWSVSSTFSWKPLVYGSYTLRVSVRPVGGSIASRSDLFYTITSQPWGGFGDAVDISAGTPIDAALGAVGEQDMYRFTVPIDGIYTIGTTGGTDTFGGLFDGEGTLVTENDNDNGANFKIVSEMAEGSVYYIGVRHADAGTGAYTLSIGRQDMPIQSVTLHANPSSSCEYNSPVRLTAEITGGDATDALYQFQVRKSGGAWQTVRDFAPENEYTEWAPTSVAVYDIRVLARNSVQVEDAEDTITGFTAVDIPEQQGVDLYSSASGSQEIYQPITLTATPQGDESLTTRAEYRFLYKRGLALTWTEITPWRDGNIVEWVPEKDGDYTLRIETRTKGRNNFDAYAEINCTINDIPNQTGVQLNTDQGSGQEPGTTITLTAGTTTDNPTIAARAEYQFQVLKGKTWTVLKDWTTENTCEWTPEAGVYTLRAYTRTIGRPDYDTYAEIEDYEIGFVPLTDVSLVGNPPSPVKKDTQVTFTAKADGTYADTAEYRFSIYNAEWNNGKWYMVRSGAWSTVNSFCLKPSYLSPYKIKVEARSPGRTTVDATSTITYNVGTSSGESVKYTYSANTMSKLQDQYGGAVKSNGSSWVDASRSDILRYVNPDNWMDGAYKYQFLSLNYISGISASDLDAILKDNSQKGGVLKGKGAVFLDAAQENDINPAYLISHAMLETGNGTSALAKGIVVNGKTVYNVFGICAYDSDPNYYGSKYAYDQGWFSVDAAIRGGAAWVSRNYINRSSGAQNTLYSMRWNPNAIQQQIDSGDDTPRPTHQYATDIAWAVKQVDRLKSLMDRCVGAVLKFIIPDYK